MKIEEIYPQMNTDEHRFLKQIRENFSVDLRKNKFFDLSDFICVHLCSSVDKFLTFVPFFVFVRG